MPIVDESTYRGSGRNGSVEGAVRERDEVTRGKTLEKVVSSQSNSRHWVLLSMCLVVLFAIKVHAQDENMSKTLTAHQKKTQYAKTVDGFVGMLVITADQDWLEKWNTEPEVVPHFSMVDKIGVGEKITALTFYSNPQTDSKGDIALNCDVVIVDPAGTVTYEKYDMLCAGGKMHGKRTNVFRTGVVIDFVGEINDPYGVWTIEFTIRDMNSGIEVPLKNSFELVDTSVKV